VNIPQQWRDTLAAIHRAGYPEAIIAGGALRDLDNGAPVKDVDVFLRTQNNDLQNLDVEFGFAGEDLTEFSVQYEQQNPDVVGVFQWYNPMAGFEIPCQVIACNGPEHAGAFREYQMDRFDIGLCRVAFDGVKVHYTSPYCLDKAERQLRIVNPRNLARSVERVRRIGEKYPNWKLVSFDGSPISRDTDDSI
jgi:hypothetical protein